MKKILCLLVAAIMIIGIVAACGNDTPTPADPPADPPTDPPADTTADPPEDTPTDPPADPPADQETIELTFWHIWEGGDANAEIVALVIDQWNAQNPHIRINVETHENEAFKTTIATAIAANTEPDIFSTWGAGFSLPFVNAGRVLNIDSFLAQAGTLDRLAGGALDYFTFDGGVYGLTFGKAASGFFVNEGLFEEHNVAIPRTWDELIEASEVLLDAGVTPIVTSSMERWVLGMLFEGMVTQAVGADNVNAALSGESNAFSDPNFLDALERLGYLRDRGFINRDASAITRDEALASFQAGNAALYFMGVWEVGALEDVGWIPFPTIPGGGGSSTEFNGGAIDGIMISSATPHPEAAFAFVEFFTENLSREGYQLGNYMPVWTTAVVDESLLNPTFVTIANTTAASTGFVLWWDTFLSGEAVDIYQDALENFFNGVITAEQAHQEFQSLSP